MRRGPWVLVATSIALLGAGKASGHLIPPEPREAKVERQARNLAHAIEVRGSSRRYADRRWHRRAERWIVREMGESWAGSVLVIRIYVGHPEADWLLSCSSGEGGWGGFVWNRDGSGAGGNMQFMRGTFDAFSGQATRWAQQLRVPVSQSAISYYSAIGQAVTASYMYRRGLSYHWVGAGC